MKSKTVISLIIFLSLFDLAGGQNMVPNDSLYFRQKRIFGKLKVTEAWEISKGSPEIKIGVIDNGFDYFHPDLTGQVIPGFYAPGVYHTEVIENIAHGTLVAGIIAAKGNNSIGVTGFAPECRVITASYGVIDHVIMKLQKKYIKENPDSNMMAMQKYLLGHASELTQFSTRWTDFVCNSNAASIYYLVDAGVKVINISGYLSKRSVRSAGSWATLERAFSYAARKNVLIIIAAGNSAVESSDYPGSNDSTIVVGASTINDKPWYREAQVKGMKIKAGSNFGRRLTVMACPDSIVVCMPSDRRYYNSNEGPTGTTHEDYEGKYQILAEGATSCATPIVTSLSALIYSILPDSDIATVRNLIINGCDDIGDPGFDIHTGFGRINYLKTLELALKLKSE